MWRQPRLSAISRRSPRWATAPHDHRPVTGGATTYSYDAAGRITGRTDAGGLTWTRTYEAQSGLPDVQQIAKTGTSRTFEYVDLDHDGAGNLVSRIQKLWAAGTTASPVTTPGDTGTGTTTYLYDGAGRMTSATGPRANGTSATWSYAYDGAGNRTSFSGPGPSGATITLTTTTDNQGWPVAIEDPSTGASPDVTLVHDEAGDLTSYDAQGSASDLGFSYDAWGLTSSGTAAGTSASYVLDPLGRIAARSQGAETIAYDYAGGTEDAVRSVATGGANPGTTTFAFAPGGPLASSKAGVTQVYLQDLHGDVVGSISPGASSLSSSAWYSAFGERTALTGTAPVLGYQGDVIDPLTGTVDMLTRNYLPMLGRFTSRDVLSGDPSDPPSLNQFVYATGSPVTFSDPTGMCADPSECPPPPGSTDQEARDWYEEGTEVTGRQEGLTGPVLDLYVYEMTHVRVAPAYLYYSATRQLIHWWDGGLVNVVTDLSRRRNQFARASLDDIAAAYIAGHGGEALHALSVLGAVHTARWAGAAGQTINLNVCVIVCVGMWMPNAGNGGSSISVASGRWKGLLSPGVPISASAYITSGSCPSCASGALYGCYGPCLGGYHNLNGPGGGWIYGVGSPGWFVGPVVSENEPSAYDLPWVAQGI